MAIRFFILLLVIAAFQFNWVLCLRPTEASFSNATEVKSKVWSKSANVTLKETTLKKDILPDVKNFFMWTREFRQGKQYELLDPKNISAIKSSHFNAGYTYVIVHGFLGNGLEFWISDLKDKLLARSDCNVISVDWESGSTWFIPSYYSAAKRVRAVGNQTHMLVNVLQTYKGLLLENVHFVGHSLGAHVAGFASKPFKGRIGRISGLDPAGPTFHATTKKNRLDKEDAIFVDIMHTNSCSRWPYWTDCFGLGEAIGHVDFWPNGGQHQPYCTGSLLRGEIGCDHEMAYRYYIESLDYPSNDRDTFFLARPCSTWDSYTAGNCSCGKQKQFMGINVTPGAGGSHYLLTSSSSPFAFTDNDCAATVSIVIMVCALICAVVILAIFVPLLAIVIKTKVSPERTPLLPAAPRTSNPFNICCL